MYIEVSEEFYDKFGALLEDEAELSFRDNSSGELVADVTEEQAVTVIEKLRGEDDRYTAAIVATEGYPRIVGVVTVSEEEVYEFEWKQ